MKIVYILLLLSLSKNGFCQKLSEDLSKRPDGITIIHFDYSAKKNESKEIFLGKEEQFQFADRKSYDRIDISQNKSDIEVIQRYLTFDFLERLQECCTEKDCPDTINGYLLLVKQGGKIESVAIDSRFISPDMCGSDELEKIITSFKNL